MYHVTYIIHDTRRVVLVAARTRQHAQDQIAMYEPDGVIYIESVTPYTGVYLISSTPI